MWQITKDYIENVIRTALWDFSFVVKEVSEKAVYHTVNYIL